MIHTYNINGITCTGCQANVQKLLSGIAGIQNVSIDLSKGEATIDMTSHILTSQLKSALKDYPKYQLEEKQVLYNVPHLYSGGETKSWFITYKSILVVFAYITGVTVLLEIVRGNFNGEIWMQNFMAGFFLVFSFFKLLDLRGFADSYSAYDIMAAKWKGWGYVYAFIELGLGLAYLSKFNPIITNAATFVLMTISIIGVLQSVLNKKKINCACLGAVFNLPMSTVTILEDGLMIVMSLIALITLV